MVIGDHHSITLLGQKIYRKSMVIGLVGLQVVGQTDLIWKLVKEISTFGDVPTKHLEL